MPQILRDLVKENNLAHQQMIKDRDYTRLDEVLENYHGFLNQAPEDPALIFMTATAELQRGHIGIAIQLLKRALAYKPDFAEAWNNLGNAWRTIHSIENARSAYERAAGLQEATEYYNNLATLYINEGCPADGIEYAQTALQLDPNNSQAHWNLGLMLLELGEWDIGLKEYEAGLVTGDRPDRHYNNEHSIPYWDGTTGKTVVVYGEQGMGDEILSAGCIPDLIKDCDKVIFECHPRMFDLFKRSFPDLHAIYPTRKKETLDWPPAHKIDYRIGIASLFKFYGVKKRSPYLIPDPDLVASYKEWLSHLGTGPFVGIGWYGGTLKTRFDQRNFKLKQLMPLLKQDATFISLQYTIDADEKVKRFYDDTGIKIHHWPEVLRAKNYDETVALIAALDKCVLPNTTAVHVCGAIGQNCTSLTSDKCAWRYTLSDKNHMPFYGDHVKLLRQNGDWEKAIQCLTL